MGRFEEVMGVPEGGRERALALAFILESELGRGKKTTDDEVNLFLEYAEVFCKLKEVKGVNDE